MVGKGLRQDVPNGVWIRGYNPYGVKFSHGNQAACGQLRSLTNPSTVPPTFLPLSLAANPCQHSQSTVVLPWMEVVWNLSYQDTVKNGSLLYHNNVLLVGHVSKLVSILLSKLSDCPNIDTSLCYCNYPFLTV